MSGTLGVDETCIGGLEGNKHESDRLKAGQHNIREPDASDQMASIAAGLMGRQLMDRELTGSADGRVH